MMDGMHLELLHAVQGIEPRVQRQGRLVAAELVPVEEGSVFLLQVSAVGQQDGAQIAGARRAMNGAGVAIARQQGQIAAVVQVGVCQHHGVDLMGRHRQRLPVAQA
ncbi:hypothetical protein D3C71_1581440 [compost metagenome]